MMLGKRSKNFLSAVSPEMWLVLVAFISSISAEDEFATTRCGYPGKPANATLASPASFYSPGDTVTFRCNDNFVLFGPDTRTCLENGTWQGDLPRCDYNFALGKPAYQSVTLNRYFPELAVDGDPKTCAFTIEDKWWQLDLGQVFDVSAVGVTITPGSQQEFSIFVIEKTEDGGAEYRHCADFRGTFKAQKGLFRCNAGLGQPGQFVHIRDERHDSEEYFGLCEVEVFTHTDRVPCGDPEQPLYTTVAKTEDQAIYGCPPEFSLAGPSVRDCLPNGQWSGKAPICLPMTTTRTTTTTMSTSTYPTSLHKEVAEASSDTSSVTTIVLCIIGILLCLGGGFAFVRTRYSNKGKPCFLFPEPLYNEVAGSAGDQQQTPPPSHQQPLQLQHEVLYDNPSSAIYDVPAVSMQHLYENAPHIYANLPPGRDVMELYAQVDLSKKIKPKEELIYAQLEVPKASDDAIKGDTDDKVIYSTVRPLPPVPTSETQEEHI